MARSEQLRTPRMRCERDLSWQSTYSNVENIWTREKGKAHISQALMSVTCLAPAIYLGIQSDVAAAC